MESVLFDGWYRHDGLDSLFFLLILLADSSRGFAHTLITRARTGASWFCYQISLSCLFLRYDFA